MTIIADHALTRLALTMAGVETSIVLPLSAAVSKIVSTINVGKKENFLLVVRDYDEAVQMFEASGFKYVEDGKQLKIMDISKRVLDDEKIDQVAAYVQATK